MSVDVSDAIFAAATPLGGRVAVLRLSGSAAGMVASQAGVALVPEPWQVVDSVWHLPAGPCPCRVLMAPAGRSYTGEEMVEILVPGSVAVVMALEERLLAQGAQRAGPGAFTRRAFAHGRLDLTQAEAVLSLTRATDESAVRAAIGHLQGRLGAVLTQWRERLTEARAAVEAGLDFSEEEDVISYDPVAIRALLDDLRRDLERWGNSGQSCDSLAQVVLVGPANAGKSALFTCLTGAPALVSDQPGTTRDWLEATWILPDGRRVNLIDTAGCDQGDAGAIAAGQAMAGSADLVIICQAPDVVDQMMPSSDLPQAHMVVATKADLGSRGTHADVAVSVHQGLGMESLGHGVAEALSACADGGGECARLCAEVLPDVQALIGGWPGDEVLADRLAAIDASLGAILGQATTDDVLDRIFARFCIGK